MYQQDNSNDDESLGDKLGQNTDDYDSGDNEKGVFIREQDRFLPIANIARIMKKAIPKNGKIAKDAKECIQECVSEFVSFITSEASDRCKHEKRKTIGGEDILFAMASLGFDNYIEPLKIYLMKYRDYTMRNEKDFKNTENKDDISNDSSSHNEDEFPFS